MISERKLQANRLNAQKSTGPRTDAGKARAALNAVRFALFASRDLVLPSEAQADYDAIRDGLLESAQPRDDIELALVERMISARWKLKRLAKVERRRYEDLRRHHGRSFTRADVIDRNFEDFEQLSRQEQRLENQFSRALRDLREWRKSKSRDAQNEQNEPTEEEVTTPQTPVSERTEDPDSSENTSATSTNGEIKNEPTEPTPISPANTDQQHEQPVQPPTATFPDALASGRCSA